MNRSHADRLVPTRTAAQLLAAASRWSQVAPANQHQAPAAPRAQVAAVAALLSNYAE